MSGRSLLLDIGNTRLKWGISDRGKIARTGSIRHDELQESGFNGLTSRLPRDIESILISNVAGPGFAARLTGVLGIHTDAEIHFARAAKSAYGVTNSYRQARRLGVDRWAAMIGARTESKAALCVVDAGTAVTIDALDRDGQHLGGQIIPGLHIMTKSLKNHTNGLEKLGKRPVDAGRGMALFANSTSRAVQTGTLNAICGAIDRGVRILRAEGYRPAIVLTGGGASRILKQLDGKVIHRPHLVLQGLQYMHLNQP